MVLKVAVAADTDPETIEKLLAGRRVRGDAARRGIEALRRLGLVKHVTLPALAPVAAALGPTQIEELRAATLDAMSRGCDPAAFIARELTRPRDGFDWEDER